MREAALATPIGRLNVRPLTADDETLLVIILLEHGEFMVESGCYALLLPHLDIVLVFVRLDDILRFQFEVYDKFLESVSLLQHLEFVFILLAEDLRRLAERFSPKHDSLLLPGGR